MLHQNKLKFVYGLLIGLFVFCSGCIEENKEIKQKEKPPNIIWLMAEDISLDLACYGMKAVKTPNLDQMALDGIKFNNAFVTNPICSPSRSAMMVGVHQVKTNTHNHRSNREVPLSKTYLPFTKLLRDAGYTTILGHYNVRGKGRKTDVNFKHEPVGEWNGKDKFGLFDKFDTINPADTPFFAQIQLNVTHRGDWWNEIRSQSEHPVNPEDVELPPYYADHPTIRLDWAKYLDTMEYMDDEVGMLYKELEEKGLYENTVVIFIGDNGRCNIRGKGYLHDPGLRIPLLMKWPKGIKPKQVRDEVVSSTDITATILDLAGVQIPKYMTGMSVLNDNFKRNEVYAARDLWDEIEEKSRAITNGKWKYIRNDKPEIPWDAGQAYLEFYRPAVHVMRTLKKEGRLNNFQKQFFENSKPKEELYNIQEDPFELKNLVDNPEFVAVLEEMRDKTLMYDSDMKPISDVYNPVHASAVDLLEWVKIEKPALYQEMLAGVEIGFQALTKEHSQLNKTN
ncbi:sulfatase-like hydrolase/transferase [Kriegella sp. EG-1]|nr:sulfatase-like hydrolase/transferase [Flavobacteriaceae bacterium EG-1]